MASIVEKSERELIADYYLTETSGLKKSGIEIMSVATTEDAIKIQLAIAKGQGHLSTAKIEWIRGLYLTAGYQLSVVDKYIAEAMSDSESMIPHLDEIAGFINENETFKKLRKTLIFNAIECAARNGFNSTERDLCWKFAQAFKLTRKEFDGLVGLHNEYEALKMKRLQLLELDGVDHSHHVQPKYRSAPKTFSTPEFKEEVKTVQGKPSSINASSRALSYKDRVRTVPKKIVL